MIQFHRIRVAKQSYQLFCTLFYSFLFTKVFLQRKKPTKCNEWTDVKYINIYSFGGVIDSPFRCFNILNFGNLWVTCQTDDIWYDTENTHKMVYESFHLQYTNRLQSKFADLNLIWSKTGRITNVVWCILWMGVVLTVKYVYDVAIYFTLTCFPSF